MKPTTLSLLGFLTIAFQSNAAVVARFSFESDFSNSVAGGAAATVNSTSTPTAGVIALGPGAPLTGKVLELNGGSTSPVDGLLIGINLGQGTNSSLASIGDNFSIAAWYRIDSPTAANGDGRNFIWEQNGGYDISYNANPATGNGQAFTQAPDSNALFAGAGTAGVWHHVVQTYETSGTNILIKNYVDGVYQALGNLTSANTAASDFNVVGLNLGMHRDEGRAFDGQIDELTIWDNTLSSADVTSLYLSQVPEPSAILLGAIGTLALFRRRRQS